MRTPEASIDFYVGTGSNAIWIGTLNSTDGEPSRMLENTDFGRHVLTATDVVTYRNAVHELFNETREARNGYAHTRTDGWPWSESGTSGADWVIQFHHGRTWIIVGYPISLDPCADIAGPVASADHTATNAATTTATNALRGTHTDAPVHQTDHCRMLFALLSDAIDAVTECDYPDSGLEEAVNDLRNAFDAYRELTEHSPLVNATTATK